MSDYMQSNPWADEDEDEDEAQAQAQAGVPSSASSPSFDWVDGPSTNHNVTSRAPTPPSPSATPPQPPGEAEGAHNTHSTSSASPSQSTMEATGSHEFTEGQLECTVDKPQKELDGTKDAYVSYLVTTKSDFQSFARREFSVRRRFTDFVFLYKTLSREYPQCAVPPLPDKHKLEYVRGDRFGPDFTHRRAHSLHRFLKRLTLHPVLRRAVLLILFLESSDWNQTMKGRSSRGASVSDGTGSAAGGGSGGIMDSISDTFVNAFTKVHKPDKRFTEVYDKANKLADDLSLVEKVVVRVARRQGDLEADYSDLATQCQKLIILEPGVEGPLTSFSSSVAETSNGFRGLKEETDQNYLTSLRDMDAYILAIKNLLKAREAKQLDFEGLTDYLAKAASDRDSLASVHGSSGLGASGFIRSKIEDVRGIDHEQSRRQRLRKLEMEIERLTAEVEGAKKATEAFDEHTVKEVRDFERIKAVEMRDTFGALADRHVDFFKGVVGTWEGFLRDLEGLDEGVNTGVEGEGVRTR